MPRGSKKTDELNKITLDKNIKAVKSNKEVKVANKGTKKANSKVASKKSNTKTSSKKSNVKNKVSNKADKKLNNFIDSFEYYDLPYRYNETTVKILAQTPKTLFVYWDISDNDRKKLIKTYGEDFFENTKPILIIYNKTKDYSFEIEINDFANSWYFNVNDEMCEYIIELGRKPKKDNFHIPNNYLYITSSNKIESPNGHILLEQNQETVYFRNVKTNIEYSKQLSDLELLNRISKIYNIYDLYHKVYKDENILDLNNPSSNNPTSTFR